MTTLARKLRLIDYFALGFGVMVGTAWLVVMDDILQRGGPLGALLGFTTGALMLLPIGYVYGQLVRAIPDAAGGGPSAARLFPPPLSLAARGVPFPSLKQYDLYRLGRYPVYLPHVLLGLTITVALIGLNYQGIQTSAR